MRRPICGPPSKWNGIRHCLGYILHQFCSGNPSTFTHRRRLILASARSWSSVCMVVCTCAFGQVMSTRSSAWTTDPSQGHLALPVALKLCRCTLSVRAAGSPTICENWIDAEPSLAVQPHRPCHRTRMPSRTVRDLWQTHPCRKSLPSFDPRFPGQTGRGAVGSAAWACVAFWIVMLALQAVTELLGREVNPNIYTSQDFAKSRRQGAPL